VVSVPICKIVFSAAKVHFMRSCSKFIGKLAALGVTFAVGKNLLWLCGRFNKSSVHP
jgi:hypothetical protein